jgi:ankyrin repeat protein
MHRFMLFLGLGTALMAGAACTGPAPTPLGAAAGGNDADTLRRLMAEGHAPDEADEYGITPLMWAARAGALGAMTALIDAGADVNARDTHNRWTPLLHAIHTHAARAVAMLLDRGADANLPAPGGLTPLLMAADDPEPGMVTVLLAHGADARAEGPGGATPLTQAVSGGALTDLTDRPLLGGCHPETVKALLAHDPSLTLPNSFAGRQALWWARFNNCDAVLTLVGAIRTGPRSTAAGGSRPSRQPERVTRSQAAEATTPQDGPQRTPATAARFRP